MTVFTDSHAHLTGVAERLGREGLEAVLAPYAAAWASDGAGRSPGVDAPRASTPRPMIVDIGVEPGDLPARFALAGPRPFLRYSAGLWPGGEVLASRAATAAALAALEADLEAAPRLGAALCAIGECGLDYHYGEDPEAQAGLFSAQAALARRTGLPLIVHSREAFADTLAILRAEAGGLEVIIHCFGYGPAEVEAFLAEGCFVSFAGNLTYKKSEALREALKLVPAERLLLETDSPYMNPEPRRGKPCSPAEVSRTYECAAALRGLPAEAVGETVSANAHRLFGRVTSR